jgi:hypothetical protein
MIMARALESNLNAVWKAVRLRDLSIYLLSPRIGIG